MQSEEEELAKTEIEKRKRNILIAISIICSVSIAGYLIYNLVLGGPHLYVKKADKLLNEKRYEEAINFYNLALEKKQNLVDALIGLGFALDSIGKSQEAINCLNRAIEINPGIARAWNYKGSALMGLGKFDSAIKCFDEALRIDAKYASTWANKASVLRTLKKYDEARICLQNYIKLRAKGLEFEITPSYVEEIIRRISPTIENVTYLKYKNEIKVKFMAPHEMEDLAKRNLLKQMKNMFPHANIKDLANQAQSLSELYSSVICGRYDFSDKILYIVPDNFQMDIVLLKIDKSKIKPLLDLLIAHELIHALQDQQFDIGTKTQAIRDIEKKQISDCIIEGHAIFVTKQVCEKIGSGKDIAELSAKVSAGDFGEASPFDRMASQYLTSLFNQTYLKGLEFIKFVNEKEGNQGIVKLFNNLPQKLSMIVRPQTYYEKAPKEIGYAKVLSAAENVIPDTGWQKHGMPIQEMSLRSGLSAWISQKKVETALTGFEEGFFLALNRGESLISIAILRFRNKKDADTFFEANSESADNQWNMLKRSRHISITVLQNREFLIPLVTSVRKAIVREAEICSQNQRTHPINVLVAGENFVIDASFINYKIEESKIKEIISKIFEKLNQELEG